MTNVLKAWSHIASNNYGTKILVLEAQSMYWFIYPREREMFTTFSQYKLCGK